MIKGTITLVHAQTKEKEKKPKQNDKEIAREAFQKRKALIKELRKLLHSNYPEIFDYANPKPLAIGIHKEVWEAFPQYSQKLIRLFLARWVKDPRYLQSLVLAIHRVNLANVTTSEVSAHEKEIAEKHLNRIKKSDHGTAS